MLYKEWLNDESIDKDWMIEPDFFRGLPLEQEDAPISAVMREAVYRYIEDAFGGSRLSLSDPVRWAELFRARLTELNGAFWKQMQMDLLVRIKDMVTADYSEYIQNYSRGVSDSSHTGSNSSDTEYSDIAGIDSTTGPIISTTTDRQSTKTTTTTTPTTAGRQVQLTSELAESSYAEPIVSDGEGLAGMPTLDTSHGDRANASWNLEGGSKVEVATETPTGEVEQVQSSVSVEQNETGSGTSTNTSTNSSTQSSVDARIGGVLREGHRDFDGYALKASIESVQMLLPYSYLHNGLGSLFRSAREEDELWL